MRAVVDTNILVSGLLNPAGAPGRVVADILVGRLLTVVTPEVMAEYRSVLARPRLQIRPDRASALLDLISQTADVLPVPPYAGRPPLPDPADWPFIACALALHCPVITGNLKHFPEGCGARVMTAREWVLGSALT